MLKKQDTSFVDKNFSDKIRMVQEARAMGISLDDYLAKHKN